MDSQSDPVIDGMATEDEPQKSSRFFRRGGIRRIQLEILVLSVLMAMVFEAIRLGEVRNALIEAHDSAADRLFFSARAQDPAGLVDTYRPVPPTNETRIRDQQSSQRTKAFWRLACWHRWEAWKYRLPLFGNASKYLGLTREEIDMRVWIGELGDRERIERSLIVEDIGRTH